MSRIYITHTLSRFPVSEITKKEEKKSKKGKMK